MDDTSPDGTYETWAMSFPPSSRRQGSCRGDAEEGGLGGHSGSEKVDGNVSFAGAGVGAVIKPKKTAKL
jgi:hypothetical protein